MAAEFAWVAVGGGRLKFCLLSQLEHYEAAPEPSTAPRCFGKVRSVLELVKNGQSIITSS
uniref:Uncharacterized protein n=1 Tax=Pyricularia oryzae (strain P131) TaxID=1143193 RepID=L7J9C0_PYRO1